MLGGSSAINGPLYIPGQLADYAGMPATGASGGPYRDVMPVLTRSGLYGGGRSDYHGTGGSMGL